MTRFALQFGHTHPGVTYGERPAAYGLCPRGEKEVALVRSEHAGVAHYALPGGALDAGQDEAAALMREFLEATGLTVWPTQVIGRAGQYCQVEGGARNTLATFYEVELAAADSAPQRDGLSLVWLAPKEALMKVRHESHAWALLHWLRARRGGEEHASARVR